MSHRTVYVGGPIDLMEGDPEARHADTRDAFAPERFIGQGMPVVYLYCPLCHQRAEPLPPLDAIKRNRAQYLSADLAIFVWDIARQVSFGSAVEIWERTERRIAGQRTVIIGPYPASMYAEALLVRGVKWFDSLNSAASDVLGGWKVDVSS